MFCLCSSCAVESPLFVVGGGGEGVVGRGGVLLLFVCIFLVTCVTRG